MSCSGSLQFPVHLSTPCVTAAHMFFPSINETEEIRVFVSDEFIDWAVEDFCRVPLANDGLGQEGALLWETDLRQQRRRRGRCEGGVNSLCGREDVWEQ